MPSSDLCLYQSAPFLDLHKCTKYPLNLTSVTALHHRFLASLSYMVIGS